MGPKVFWAVVVGFLLGVFARSFVLLGWSVAAAIALLGAALLTLSYFERKSALVIAAIALFAGAVGVLRMDGAAVTGEPALSSRLGSSVVLEGAITAEPDIRDTAVRVTMHADTLVASSARQIDEGIIAALPSGSDVAYGERIRVSGFLQLPQSFDSGEGRSFAYPQYLGKDGIAYVVNRARFAKLAEPAYTVFGTPNYFTAGALYLKQLYLAGLRATLPEPEAGLAGGITAGDKRSLGTELNTAFQRDSLVHMVVLSGYNITVVLNAIAKLMSWAPRAVGFGGAVSVVIFFMLMSGGAASASRAGLMALIAVYARTSGRLFLAERALAAVSLAMVAMNPFTLAFDPSFQLSALATLGLILFTSPIANTLTFVTEARGVREILSSTLATQLTVLPLLLYQNGLLSLVALPANLLALFPVPYAMFFSFVAGVAGMLFGSLAAPLALPAYALLAYIISVARLFASLPLAAVSVPAFSAWWMAAAYALLFALQVRLNTTAQKKTAG
jgi:competence protein ComEC